MRQIYRKATIKDAHCAVIKPPIRRTPVLGSGWFLARWQMLNLTAFLRTITGPYQGNRL